MIPPFLPRWGVASLVGLAASVTLVRASFNAQSSTNLALYWGQNSYQQPTGKPHTQQRLAYYCENEKIDIIPIAFLNVIVNPTTVNFANAGDNCTVIKGSTLLSCPQLEEDIETCQSEYGKTILLSIGGATYTEGGFSSPAAAATAADRIWAMFGPAPEASRRGPGSAQRPFGSAVVDGFDFDFESRTTNMISFARRLRTLMDAATDDGDKRYYLSAAPQCPYPDLANRDMLEGTVAFDFIMVQFYNNYCGLQSFAVGASRQNNFNMATWDDWAQRVSLNVNVRVFLGIPGNVGAGAGYQPGPVLAAIIAYAKQFPSFGGVMVWDTSQTYANAGFLDQLVDALHSRRPAGGPPPSLPPPPGPPPPPSPTTLTYAPRPAPTAGGGAAGGGVGLWGQCGGSSYKGPTDCAPGLLCVANSEWWAQCQ